MRSKSTRLASIDHQPKSVQDMGVLLFILILLLMGCTNRPSSDQTQSETALPTNTQVLPTQTNTHEPATPTPSALPTSTPTPARNSSYFLDAILDYDRRVLKVDQKIDYFNRSSDTIKEMILMVDPLYYPGTFQLESLTWGDGSTIENYQTETGRIRFVLKNQLLPGENVELGIKYQLTLPSPQPSPTTRPVPFGYTERQVNLVDWYPFVPPYISGQGWISHPASYYGEHLAYEMADFVVNFRLAKPNPNQIIAASAPAIIEGDWLRYEHRNARTFAMSVSPYYQVISGQVGQTTVYSYAFPAQDEANQAVLQTTLQALELYNQLFGEYPRESLSVVEADFLDGMEYDGMYFLSKGFYNLYTGGTQEYLVAIAAHETSHQWWYGLLGNDQAMEPWLDEALSTYSERIFYEKIYPEALDWWWQYRIYFYDPHGYVDDTIYNPHAQPQPYRSYRDAVYLNGAVFLEELRTAMGDNAFFEFLSAYANQYRNQFVNRQSFFTLLEEYYDGDLSAIINKYFFNP